MAKYRVQREMARSIGFDHGLMAGTEITAEQVLAWSHGWYPEEIDAYLAGRAEGVIEKLTRLAANAA